MVLASNDVVPVKLLRQTRAVINNFSRGLPLRATTYREGNDDVQRSSSGGLKHIRSALTGAVKNHALSGIKAVIRGFRTTFIVI